MVTQNGTLPEEDLQTGSDLPVVEGTSGFYIGLGAGVLNLQCLQILAKDKIKFLQEGILFLSALYTYQVFSYAMTSTHSKITRQIKPGVRTPRTNRYE